MKQAVDPISPALYIVQQVGIAFTLESQLDIKKLEERVDELINTVERLRTENKTLRDSQTHLAAERDRLMTKTEQARTRVESMIERLKAMSDE